jgi:hypothetical protein
MRRHGALFRKPLLHRQYFGLLLSPKPAPPSNIKRIFPRFKSPKTPLAASLIFYGVCFSLDAAAVLCFDGFNSAICRHCYESYSHNRQNLTKSALMAPKLAAISHIIAR